MRRTAFLYVIMIFFIAAIPLLAKGPKSSLPVNETTDCEELEGGLRVQKIYAGPVNYRDGSGNWKKINTALSRKSGAFVNTENTLNSEFSDDPAAGVIYYKNGRSMKWKLRAIRLLDGGGTVLFSPAGRGVKASGMDNAVRYTGIFDSITDEYLVRPGNVKNNIILSDINFTGMDKAAILEVEGEFLLSGNFEVLSDEGPVTGNAEIEGGFYVKTGGTEAFYINPAYAFDTPAPSGYDKKFAPKELALKYYVSVEKRKVRVALRIPAVWLKSTDVRYPVYIDPTVSLGIPNWQRFNSQEDTDISSAVAVNNGTATTMTIGRNDAGAVLRGLYKFDLSSIPSTSVVKTAFLQVYNSAITTGSTGIDYYEVHEVLAVPPATPAWWTETGATWANRVAGTAWQDAGGDFDTMITARTLIDVAEPIAYRQWNITSLAAGWIKGTKTNNGLIIKADNTREAAGIHGEVFHSRENTNIPYISVEYYASSAGAVSSWAQDTILRQGLPYANFGTYTYMDIRGDSLGSDVRRSVLQFDLSMLPSNITVTNAGVSMYVYTDVGFSSTVDMYPVTNTAWTDTRASWVSRTAATTWSAQGGDYYPSVLGFYVFPNTVTYGYYSWSMPVTVVAGWMDGSIQNNGVLFRVRNEAQTRGISVYSHENTQYHPRLDLTYTAAAGFTPPELIKPLGGETIDQGYFIKWRWGSKDDIADPFNLQYYIEYSNNSGSTWYPLATTTAKSNVFSWDTSSLAEGVNYRVRIAAYDYSGSLAYSAYSVSSDFSIQRFTGGSFIDVQSATALPVTAYPGGNITVVFSVYNNGFEGFTLLPTALSVDGISGGDASLLLNNEQVSVPQWGIASLTWVYSAASLGTVSFSGRIDAEGEDSGSNTQTARGVTGSVFIIPVPTATPSITVTSSRTPSHTVTLTPTRTSTLPGTVTYTPTATCTYTVTATVTPTDSPTGTATNTVTQTITGTVTGTGTPTSTGTTTPTATGTATPTLTTTRTVTGTATLTESPTATPTGTQTDTPTATRTMTETVTQTATGTVTQTVTQTMTGTVTRTVTETITGTVTGTVTTTVTATATQTVTETVTRTVTQTATPTVTQTVTKTVTGTHTATVTGTATETVSETATGTVTGTVTETDTATVTGTMTETATKTVTETVTETAAETTTETVTGTDTETATETVTETATETATMTFTETGTGTGTETPTETITETATGTSTGTVTETAAEAGADTQTVTPSATFTLTGTETVTATFTPTPTPAASPASTATPGTSVFVYGDITGGSGSIKLVMKLNAPETAWIYLYNIAGEITFRAPVAMNAGWNEWEWQGRTPSGQKAARGIYILRVKAEGRDRLIKIAVK